MPSPAAARSFPCPPPHTHTPSLVFQPIRRPIQWTASAHLFLKVIPPLEGQVHVSRQLSLICMSYYPKKGPCTRCHLILFICTTYRNCNTLFNLTAVWGAGRFLVANLTVTEADHSILHRSCAVRTAQLALPQEGTLSRDIRKGQRFQN